MKTSTDDVELVERLQTADVEAFDLIYAKYSGKLYKFGLKHLRSAAEAEELVQSVFIKIWENRKTLRKELSFKSFLFTIAYNDICKLFRKRNYLRKFINDSLAENPDSSFKIEDKIDFLSVIEMVKKIINGLPERQRTIFKKSREEGKTTKEIAAELNLSPGTVDNYISESLKFIRSRLCKEDLSLILFFTMFFL